MLTNNKKKIIDWPHNKMNVCSVSNIDVNIQLCTYNLCVVKIASGPFQCVLNRLNLTF